MIQRIHFLFALILLVGCTPKEPATLKQTPRRIISLAPDITEMVYALKLGDKLVGATTYCLYPQDAKKLPRVGGFGQFNFEAIVSLHPDVIILHSKYDEEKGRLESLGIPYIETATRSISDILESMQKVGKACGAENTAKKLLADINHRINNQPKKTKNAPRVLITFGGDANKLDQIYAFGQTCLHNELLELAGGKNVIENQLAFSSLSKEAVIRLNPDIIIQLAPGIERPTDPAAAWKRLTDINAVKNNRIYLLNGDYTCIPGPRFIQILEDFTQIISPNHSK